MMLFLCSLPVAYVVVGLKPSWQVLWSIQLNLREALLAIFDKDPLHWSHSIIQRMVLGRWKPLQWLSTAKPFLTLNTQALWTLFWFPADVSCLYPLAYGGDFWNLSQYGCFSLHLRKLNLFCETLTHSWKTFCQVMPQSLLPALDYVTSPGIIIPTLVTIFIMLSAETRIVTIATNIISNENHNWNAFKDSKLCYYLVWEGRNTHFPHSTKMISGAADSYNLVPVDPHINAQGEHRGPKGSGKGRLAKP